MIHRLFGHGLTVGGLVTVALGLGGCANLVSGIAGTQDTRILNPDSVQGERQRSGLSAVSSPTGGSRSASDSSTERLRGETVQGATLCLDTAPATKDKFKFFCRQWEYIYNLPMRIYRVINELCRSACFYSTYDVGKCSSIDSVCYC